MLSLYESGIGSAAAAAEQSADSWEGSLNRLSATWTETIGNITDSGAFSTAIEGLNGLLSGLNQITGAVGPAGTLGALSGLLMNKNGIGERTMFQW